MDLATIKACVAQCKNLDPEGCPGEDADHIISRAQDPSRVHDPTNIRFLARTTHLQRHAGTVLGPAPSLKRIW